MNQKTNTLSPNAALGGGIAITILIALTLLRFFAGNEEQAHVQPPGQRPPFFHGQAAPLQHNPEIAENIEKIFDPTIQYAPTELEDPSSALTRHFSATAATAIGQAALPGTEALSPVATLVAGTSLKTRPRQVPLPIAKRNNPWIKRLSSQEGAESMAHYRTIGAVVSNLQGDVARITEPSSAKTFDEKRAVLSEVQKALERAQRQLERLGSEGVDERSLQLTKVLREIVQRLEASASSQEALLANIDRILVRDNELIQEKTQTDVLRSIDESVRSLTGNVARLWGPDSGIKRVYQEWLMDRYGIDSSKVETQEPAAR